MAADRREGESFIGEPIEPKPGTFDTARMATGEPGLPRVFRWRDVEYTIVGVIEAWRSQEPGVGIDKKHLYIRKHFYRVKTTTGEVMTLYFDRKPPSGREKSRQRWYLFSISNAGPNRSSAG
jgi:hypothetical protein